MPAHIPLARSPLAGEGRLPAADVERTLTDADRLVEGEDIGYFRPHLRELRAVLARRRGCVEEAGRLRSQALCLYREIGATGHAARLEAASETAGSAGSA